MHAAAGEVPRRTLPRPPRGRTARAVSRGCGKPSSRSASGSASISCRTGARAISRPARGQPRVDVAPDLARRSHRPTGTPSTTTQRIGSARAMRRNASRSRCGSRWRAPRSGRRGAGRLARAPLLDARRGRRPDRDRARRSDRAASAAPRGASSASSTSPLEPAGDALVDARRIREAVADHPAARAERRPDASARDDRRGRR